MNTEYTEYPSNITLKDLEDALEDIFSYKQPDVTYETFEIYCNLCPKYRNSDCKGIDSCPYKDLLNK